MSTNTVSVLNGPCRVSSAGIGNSRRLSVPHMREGIGAVRRRAAAVLEEWGTAPAVAEDVLLVVSELVTNAIVHARAPVTLRLSLAQADDRPGIRVEVTDRGPARAHGPDEWVADEHGRGDLIIEALAAYHSRLEFPGGTTCRADMML